MRLLLTTTMVALSACGLDSTASVEDVWSEELDAAGATQELNAEELNVAPQELDVAVGTYEGRVAKVLTSASAARQALGPVLPPITYSRNWLVAWRPEGKTVTSRLEVTRAQLSSTGKTLSLWATVTEPGAGCQAWRPNELAVVRVPSRATVPTSLRVYVTRAVSACGLTVGPACASTAPCAAPTSFCLGRVVRDDGTAVGGTCVKLPAYDGSSAECSSDAACGPDGLCAGLSQGFGLCQPAWMRGTFSQPVSGQLSVPLPRDGSWTRVVVPVSGLSTVAMDAWAQLFFDATAAQVGRVEARLINPSGTASRSFTPATMGARVVVGVPGDESLSGEWAVELRDTNTSGAPVVFRGARLSFTSRWD